VGRPLEPQKEASAPQGQRFFAALAGHDLSSSDCWPGCLEPSIAVVFLKAAEEAGKETRNMRASKNVGSNCHLRDPSDGLKINWPASKQVASGPRKAINICSKGM